MNNKAVALIDMTHSRLENTEGKPTLGRVAIIASLAPIALWAIGCAGGGAAASQYKLSVNRMHSLDLSLLMYTSDYDEVLPLPSKWMDGLIPYAKDETLFHSPAVGARGYGYALNISVAGIAAPAFASPVNMVTVFDSTDLARNATEPISTEPSPPRYGSKNTIAYLDGHVQDYNAVNSIPIATQAENNLKHATLAVEMYSNDYDDYLPLPNKWMDELEPYVKNDAVFHSLGIAKAHPSAYCYSFNSAIAGISIVNIAQPSTTPMIFDSTVLTRNATASISTLPAPPRYGKKNMIGYADGHVKLVP